MTNRQKASLILLALCFLMLDLGLYHFFTKYYINSTSPEMQAKSIEVSEYLPFREQSKIVKVRTDLKLKGDLPVLDGAAALFPVYSAFASAVYPEESVLYDESTGAFSETSALQYTNTRGAYQGIVDGDCDLIFCAKPSEEQLRYAEEKGVTLEFVPIGREAFVFIVNGNNPVNNISVEELKAIYAGEIRNWKELGGKNRPIHATQRNEGSGSQTAFLSLMDGAAVKPSILGPLGDPIGFSFRFYVEDLVGNGSIKMLSLNGVYPDKESIRNGSYPIVGDIYAVYRKGDDDPNLRRLLDWILSEEGQYIVEESGYVSIQGQ